MKKSTARLIGLLLAIFTALPTLACGEEIRVSAAASLGDALRELSAAFTRLHPGTTILPNLGASGMLAKQIAQGAPSDIFISANREWIDYLNKEGQVTTLPVLLAANQLVFVGKANPALASLAALAQAKRIAIGNPQSVPAGLYAEQAMRGAGIYEQLSREGRLVLTKDVRQALLYADQGEVDGAFVYRTDALQASASKQLFTVPANLHEAIVYPAALIKNGENNPAARSFLEYLTSPAGQAILGGFGFTPPPATR